MSAVNEHRVRCRRCSVRPAAPNPTASVCPLRRAAARCGQDLLISYGISIDKEAQNRDRVTHTAARVGLSIHPDALLNEHQPPAANKP